MYRFIRVSFFIFQLTISVIAVPPSPHGDSGKDSREVDISYIENSPLDLEDSALEEWNDDDWNLFEKALHSDISQASCSHQYGFEHRPSSTFSQDPSPPPLLSLSPTVLSAPAPTMSGASPVNILREPPSSTLRTTLPTFSGPSRPTPSIAQPKTIVKPLPKLRPWNSHSRAPQPVTLKAAKTITPETLQSKPLATSRHLIDPCPNFIPVPNNRLKSSERDLLEAYMAPFNLFMETLRKNIRNQQGRKTSRDKIEFIGVNAFREELRTIDGDWINVISLKRHDRREIQDELVVKSATRRLIRWVLFYNAAFLRTRVAPRPFTTAQNEIIAWLVREFFQPRSSLPVIGEFNMVRGLRHTWKDFRPLQIILISCLTKNDDTKLYQETACIVVAVWYKILHPKEWNFISVQSFWTHIQKAAKAYHDLPLDFDGE